MNEEENGRPGNGYILLTCFKDEADYLPGLLESISKQTILPNLWLLVDDGSIDSSLEIVERFAGNRDWIKIQKRGASKRDIGLHIGQVYIDGFGNLRKIAESLGIRYDFIGLLDADFIINENYYKRLIEEFRRIKLLGAASGGVYLSDKKSLRIERAIDSLPRGGVRLWKRDCFDEIDGYRISYSADTVAAIHAIEKGWWIRQFKDIIAVQRRPTSSAEGIISGQICRGMGDYYLGRKFGIALARSIFYSLYSPSLRGFGYLWGYLIGMAKGNRIDDDIVRGFFSKESIIASMVRKESIFDQGKTWDYGSLE